jgi:hypothetical protein
MWTTEEKTMLKLLKIKREKTEALREEIVAVPKAEFAEASLPAINLFISVEQLMQLDAKDTDREEQAKMFLKSKNMPDTESAVYKGLVERFEKAYLKLGNANQQCPHCRREYTSLPVEMKKCLGCSKAFFKTKRPQDGMTVLVREENRELITLQWENIKKAELIQSVDREELEKIRSKLQQQDGGRVTLYDAHFYFVKQHLSKALLSGRFRLYSSLIYYMAEYDRYKKDFAQALSYYFYLYYLQLNGASNSVVFGDKVSVNKNILRRIADLLKMAQLLTTECKEIFSHSIEKLSVFEDENLPYTVDETYAHLLNTFERAEGREVVEVIEEKPKAKSFRLQR